MSTQAELNTQIAELKDDILKNEPTLQKLEADFFKTEDKAAREKLQEEMAPYRKSKDDLANLRVELSQLKLAEFDKRPS